MNVNKLYNLCIVTTRAGHYDCIRYLTFSQTTFDVFAHPGTRARVYPLARAREREHVHLQHST